MGKTIIISNRLPVQLQISNGDITAIPSVGGLATGMKSNRVCLGIEKPEEARNKTVVGQILTQLIVDMDECIVEARIEPDGHAQHCAYLRSAQRRSNAVAGCIPHEEKQPRVVERDKVIQVPAGLISGFECAAELIAGDLGHGRW